MAISRTGGSTNDSVEDDTAAILGVIQAIVSVFADNGDKIRFINTQSTRIAFLLRTPLYLVSVATIYEPEAVVCRL
jgi:vacuolar fusion protein MON1